MKLTKKIISKNISSETNLSLNDSNIILNSFFDIVTQHLKINKDVKISRFGSFQNKITPKRIGRNPKTKESYIIRSRKRVKFVSSNKMRSILN
tara:strand:+ start:361 stop:639 length:279 start_codon:yes stop_codon:yes gene_type:complete